MTKKSKITKEQIQDVIDAACAKHNEGIEAYNAEVDKHNKGKSWRDNDYKYRKEELEIGSYHGPEEILLDKDLDFGVFTFKQVDQEGGEGEGDHYHEVYLVTNTKTKETVHIKFDAYYNSEEGANFDGDFDFVEPYEKTVRDWRKI